MDRLTALQQADAAQDDASETSSVSEADRDLALARLLQEQENAFMFLNGDSGGASEHYSADEASELDDDEALARRLQAEEQQELHRRLLAMAGLNADESGEPQFEQPEDTDPARMTYEELGALRDLAGVVSKGLAPDAVQRLPQRSYAELKQQAAGCGSSPSSEDICAICRMDFEDADECKLLPRCSHCYHAACIEQWLGVNKVCPMCNAEVVAPPAADGGPEAGLVPAA